jgi:hypothetical protein
MAGQRHNLRALEEAGTMWHVVCASMLLLAMPARLAAAAPTPKGMVSEPCPPGAISVAPGRLHPGCGRPRGRGRRFLPQERCAQAEGRPATRGTELPWRERTVVNGSRLITRFSREGRYWVASNQWQRGGRHGKCTAVAPACKFPEGFFIDDQPLTQVLDKESIGPGVSISTMSTGNSTSWTTPLDERLRPR